MKGNYHIMLLTNHDLFYLGTWSVIGSVLGYLSFNKDYKKYLKHKIKRCALSVCIGLFVALPLTEYLIEFRNFSKHFSMHLGVIGAFCLPTILLRYWNKLIDIGINKLAGNTKDDTNE